MTDTSTHYPSLAPIQNSAILWAGWDRAAADRAIEKLRAETQSPALKSLWELIVIADSKHSSSENYLLEAFPDLGVRSVDVSRDRAAAWNAGAERARGGFLFFFTADSLIQPGALVRLEERVRGADWIVASDGPTVGLLSLPYWVENGLGNDSFIAVRREHLEKVGGFITGDYRFPIPARFPGNPVYEVILKAHLAGRSLRAPALPRIETIDAAQILTSLEPHPVGPRSRARDLVTLARLLYRLPAPARRLAIKKLRDKVSQGFKSSR